MCRTGSEPLLCKQHGTGESHREFQLVHDLSERLIGIRHHVHFWWSVTVNPDYKASWASRRSLKLFLPYIMLQMVVSFELDSPEWNQYMERPLLNFSVVSITLLLWTRHQIWSDCIMAGFKVILASMLKIQYSTDAIVCFAVWGATSMSFIGCHCLAIFVYIVLLNCMQIYGGSLTALQSIVSFAIVPIVFAIEFRSASAFNDLQQKIKSLEMLLDKATDGFCTVDSSSGIIRSASPGLERTFGNSGKLIGKRMYDLVHKRDHSAIQAVLQLPAGVRETTPTLVTCTQEENSVISPVRPAFDVKIIPFAESSHIVQICVQVQGEMRMSREFFDSRSDAAKGDPSSSPRKESLSPRSPWSPKKAPSEASLAYSLTESMVSSSPKRKFRETWLPLVSSSSQVIRKDAEVQTADLQRPPLLPDTFPKQVSRGRSALLLRRQLSKPQVRSISQGNERQSIAQPLRIRISSEQGECQQENIPRPEPKMIDRSRGRRQRIGRDMSLFQA